MADTPDASDRERRINDAIAGYLESLDAGQVPDRQAWLARHPDLTPELEAFLADQDRLGQIADQLRPAQAEGHGDSGRPVASEESTIFPAPTVDEPTLPPGTSVRYFGDYELIEEVARGGMGVVYKARQISLGRVVALKMILSGALASAEDVRRFRAEAEAAAQLDHPHIVPIYEVGEYQGQQYYTMKFVPGPSLAGRLAAGPLSNREAAEIVGDCALAVQYAHDHGVIHRDLKPANVLLDSDGRPQVTDFGLAKRVDRQGGLTQTGALMGTPGYMPPEQAGGAAKSVGPAADVYSLGAVLYALLTGRPPFQAESVPDTLLQVVLEDPTPPTRLNPRVARDLENVCLKCLEKRPERRYASAKELADEMGRFLAYEPVLARPPGATRRLGQWARRRPWIITLTATTAAFLGFVLVYWLWASLRAQEWKSLYFEEQAARQALPVGAPDNEPSVQHVRELLRRLNQMHPDPRIYVEALELLRTEGQGGRQIFPPADSEKLPKTEIPTKKSFHWPSARLATAANGRLVKFQGILIDTNTGRTEQLRIPNAASSDIDSSGRLLVTRAGDSKVEVWDRAGQQKVQVFDRAPDQIDHLWFIPGGERLMLLTNQPGARRMEFWDLGRKSPRIVIDVLGAAPYWWTVSGDGSRAAWHSSDSPKVHVYNLEDGHEVAAIDLLSEPICMALDSTGDRLVWCRRFRSPAIELLALPAGNLVRRFSLPESEHHIDRIELTPGGGVLLGQSMNRTYAWDIETGDLALWWPSRWFATSSGAEDDVVIEREEEAGPDRAVLAKGQTPGYRLELWPLDIRSRIADAGLTSSMRALVAGYQPKYPGFIAAFFPWYACVGLAASILFVAVGGKQFWVEGSPVPAPIAVVGALAGTIAMVFAVRHLVVSFLPDGIEPNFLSFMGDYAAFLFGLPVAFLSFISFRSDTLGEPIPSWVQRRRVPFLVGGARLVVPLVAVCPVVPRALHRRNIPDRYLRPCEVCGLADTYLGVLRAFGGRSRASAAQLKRRS